MPYLPCSTKRKRNSHKIVVLQTHESPWEQLECQVNNPALQQDKAVDGWLHPQESFA